MQEAVIKAVQFEIEGRTWALLPLTDHEVLCQQAKESSPSSFVERPLLSGENPGRVWREHRGLSASELARRASVSNAHISAIESGVSTASVQTLRRIAKALETTIDTLVLS